MMVKQILTYYFKGLSLIVASLLVTVTLSPAAAALSGSNFNKSRIIDDSKFYRQPSMSATAIQNFFNSRVPNCDTNGTRPYAGTTRAAYGTSRGYPPPYTCLKDYRMDTPSRATSPGLCSSMSGKSNQTAAQIIYDVSIACSIDTKVLVVLLEKEQSLVSDDWPWSIQYRSATGYGCPDTAPCDSEYYGFFNQVYNAARQFKNYRRNPGSFNYAAGRRSYVAYQAKATHCGGSYITPENAATAALYNYTPYQPNAAALTNLYGEGDACSAYGNRNFWRLYNDWFGPSISGSCINGSNIDGAASGKQILRNSNTLAFTQFNNTGSSCVEIHNWNPGFNSWSANIATNLASTDPENKSIVRADTNGNGKDELHYIKYQSGSGRVEVHTWDGTYHKWSINVATNLENVDPSKGVILGADLDGDGKDELHYIKYQSGSGRVEVHTWAPGYAEWQRQVATHQTNISRSFGRIIAGDTNGDGRDELHYIKYQSTGSGRVEIHTFAPDLKGWSSNRATNVGQFDPDTREVISGDTNGDGRDEMMYIRYTGTSSGRVEVHTWNPGYRNWLSNRATNLSQFDPTQ